MASIKVSSHLTVTIVCHCPIQWYARNYCPSNDRKPKFKFSPRVPFAIGGGGLPDRRVCRKADIPGRGVRFPANALRKQSGSQAYNRLLGILADAQSQQCFSCAQKPVPFAIAPYATTEYSSS